MKLNQYLIKNEKHYLNKQIKDISLYSKYTLLFKLDKEEGLYISLNKTKQGIFFYHVDNELKKVENPFINRIYPRLRNGRITKLSRHDVDNIYEIEITSDSPYIFQKVTKIIIHFFALTPNIYVINEDNKILDHLLSYRADQNKINHLYHHEPTIHQDIEIPEINYENIYYYAIKEIRKKERRTNLNKYLTNRLKQLENKKKKIEEEHLKYLSYIKTSEIINNVFNLGLNLKAKYHEILIDNITIELDEKISLLENVNNIYKRAKKAKSEDKLYNSKVQQLLEEYSLIKADQEQLDNISESEVFILEKKYNLIKNYIEKNITNKNAPYFINVDGTIYLFGKNIDQNDYLSFEYKTNRNFIWFHIKDYSSGHVLIKKEKPNEREIKIAATIALLTKKMKRGEVIYTAKKNLRRTKNKGEAIVKNYSSVYLNEIDERIQKLYLEAKRENLH